MRRLAAVLALALSAYHLVVAVVGPPITEAHRATHFMLGIAVLFCLGTISATETRRPRQIVIDLVFLCAILVPAGYVVIDAYGIASRMLYVTPVTPSQEILGWVVVVATLEATRRLLGWPMVILSLIFLIYTQAGPHLPYPFWHRGYPIDQVIEQIYLSVDGLWGIPIGASASYIFLFVLFGALLVSSGAGTFFSRFANALTGNVTGGPAKTAVLSSAMMSMLSGSSTANVVTTGSFTIPAMRTYGYNREFAAGVEAVASTGGLITPPVMGAAAFIMADFLGLSYSDIMIAAAIPAFLYFVAIFIAVDVEARRNRLTPPRDTGGESLCQILKEGVFMLLPLGVMIATLLQGLTPSLAGLYGILAFLLCLTVRYRREPRRIVRIFLEAAIEAPKMMAPVIAACAVGGIIAGIISLTGLGVRFTSIIAYVAGDSAILFLTLTMIVAVILGMGMPTSAVYIILASILAPGMVELGFQPLAAHMFIFFGAVMSNITPPLAIASFAAAAVAGGDPWRTSVHAVKMGVGVFLLPFIFVYEPALLGQGSLLEVGHAMLTAVIGIAVLSIAATGWFLRPLHPVMRLILVAGAIGMIFPGTLSDVLGLTAIAAVALLLWLQWRRPATS
ncbi:TRAP transporter fused permease subunit [uncultured Tistrella sp.]|nr:TRAP transporter fused permease subunit [uncultured Tistrella sp.]MAM73811.1 TRAP transporter permease DctM/Q [Tistrella sp.]